MFGLSGRGDDSHDEAVWREVEEAQMDPFQKVVATDHIDDDRPSMDIGGRTPDLVTENCITGERTAVEVESNPNTTHSQNQMNDLREGAEELGMNVEMESVDENTGWSLF